MFRAKTVRRFACAVRARSVAESVVRSVRSAKFVRSAAAAVAAGVMLLCGACASQKTLPSRAGDADGAEAVAARSGGSSAAAGNSYTLAQRRILDILKAQDDLFADPNIGAGNANADAELLTKAMRVNSLWKTFFLDNPDDFEAHVLYGKFLRRIGQPDRAYETFKRADELRPNVPVVLQQLSALEAESGEAAKAFGHVRAALEAEPDNAVFLLQCAYIMVLGKNEIAGEGKILSPAEFDALLTACYRKIAEQNPDDRAAKVRYAQSFYDLFAPDWQKALSIWRDLEKSASLNLELQTARANIARVLVELGRDAEAERILQSVDAPSLARAKTLLLREIERAADSRKNRKTSKNNL